MIYNFRNSRRICIKATYTYHLYEQNYMLLTIYTQRKEQAQETPMLELPDNKTN